MVTRRALAAIRQSVGHHKGYRPRGSRADGGGLSGPPPTTRRRGRRRLPFLLSAGCQQGESWLTDCLRCSQKYLEHWTQILSSPYEWCVGASLQATYDGRDKNGHSTSMFMRLCPKADWTGNSRGKVGNACKACSDGVRCVGTPTAPHRLRCIECERVADNLRCRGSPCRLSMTTVRGNYHNSIVLRKCTWLKCCYGRRPFGAPPQVEWNARCEQQRKLLTQIGQSEGTVEGDGTDRATAAAEEQEEEGVEVPVVIQRQAKRQKTPSRAGRKPDVPLFSAGQRTTPMISPIMSPTGRSGRMSPITCCAHNSEHLHSDIVLALSSTWRLTKSQSSQAARAGCGSGHVLTLPAGPSLAQDNAGDCVGPATGQMKMALLLACVTKYEEQKGWPAWILRSSERTRRRWLD